MLEHHRKWEEARIKAGEHRRRAEEYLAGESFCVSGLDFEQVEFGADHSYDDDWINMHFRFSGVTGSIDPQYGAICIAVGVPQLYGANSKEKHPESATEELELSFCLYLQGHGMQFFIPSHKVSDGVKETILAGCSRAMAEYNKGHMDMIESTNCTPVLRFYPKNFFLDNNIGSLKLVYRVGREPIFRHLHLI